MIGSVPWFDVEHLVTPYPKTLAPTGVTSLADHVRRHSMPLEVYDRHKGNVVDR